MTANQDTLKTESAQQDNARRGSRRASRWEAGDNVEDQAVVTYVTLPPDGGWGWVVVAASFYCMFFNDGIVNTAGLFIGRVDDELGVSKTSVSLMGSCLTGFSLFSGPFASALTNRYGFRTPAVLGNILACVGFVISSTSGNIHTIWLTYGMLAGTGFGMGYVPAMISIGFYFERWRSLATSIASCGAGFGTIILAPTFAYLMEKYGWRFTILVQAGMMLSCSIVSLAYRPLKPVQVTSVSCDEDEGIGSTEDNQKKVLSTNNNAHRTIVKSSNEELKKGSSNMSVNTDVNVTVTTTRAINSLLKAANNDKYATVHDVLSNSHRNIRNVFDVSNSSVNKQNESQKNISKVEVTATKDNRLGVTKKPNRLSICSILSHDSEGSQSRIDDLLTKHLNSSNNRRRTSVMRLLDAGAITEVNNIRKHSILHAPRNSISPSECAFSRLDVRRATITSGVRPLYREDIFLQANLKRLPQYSSKNSRLEYAMTVTHLPTLNDVLEEETCKCILCPEAMRRTLATMLDMSLLTSPSFFLLCFSGFLTNMGFYIPYMYLESRLKDGGLDPGLGKWMISTIGISNTVGRGLCGLASSLPNVSAILVNNVMLTVAGIATILSGLYMTVAYQFTYAIVFGFCVSAFSSLRSIVTVDLIGLEKLTNGFGIMLLYQGISALIGPPLAGLIMEWTQSYNVMFIQTGCMILLSAVMCYPLGRLNKWEKARELKKEAKSALETEIA